MRPSWILGADPHPNGKRPRERRETVPRPRAEEGVGHQELEETGGAAQEPGEGVSCQHRNLQFCLQNREDALLLPPPPSAWQLLQQPQEPAQHLRKTNSWSVLRLATCSPKPR